MKQLSIALILYVVASITIARAATEEDDYYAYGEDVVTFSKKVSASSITKTEDFLENSLRPVNEIGAYICLEAQRSLCLGISTSDIVIYDPNNLIGLQVKHRDRNELRGTDFMKMRWNMYPSAEGKVKLANNTNMCVTKKTSLTSTNERLEVVLRPCNMVSIENLGTWDLPFVYPGDDHSDDIFALRQTGKIQLRSNPNQCLTLMKCGTTAWGGCNPAMVEPFTGTIINEAVMSGAYVKLSPCSSDLDTAQTFRQLLNCSPGCSTLLLENDQCDTACQTPACNWDDGMCPVITASPTFKPTRSPTEAPTTTRRPTKAPTFPAPTASPTVAPTASPTLKPTTAAPTAFPTKSPSASPTRAPTLAPTTSKPTRSPTTLSPTRSPTAPANVSSLGAAPLSTESPSAAWWVWLVIVLCLLLLLSLVLAVCVRRYRKLREEREAREEEERRRAAEKERDLENQAPLPAPAAEDKVDVNVDGTLVDPALPEPPAVNDYYVNKAKRSDDDSKTRKATRRSVISLINAMSDLETAFAAAEKEMPDESELGDGQDPETKSALKRRSMNSQLTSMEKDETKELANAVKASKFQSAISTLERAIGKLERRMDHEKLRGVSPTSAASSFGGRRSQFDDDASTAGSQRPRRVSFASDFRDGRSVDTENDVEMQNALGYMMENT